MTQTIAIHWFRQDLRIEDNPAFTNAAKHDAILPIYILDDQHSAEYAMGSASRWWLHYSLMSLRESLKGHLSIYQGDPLFIFKQILSRFNVDAVYWNRCYEPWRIQRDTKIKKYLQTHCITVETSNGSLLWEPWTIKKSDGTHYKVFTPFYRKGCLGATQPRKPLPVPKKCHSIIDTEAHASRDALNLLNLLPKKIRWDKQLALHWHIGEKSAHACFQEFIQSGLLSYQEGRNFPSKRSVSRLSPYLHFGQVSPNQLWHVVKSMGDDKNIEHFCSELGWREFSYSQLYHYPDLPRKNLQSKFDAFPWVENQQYLAAWQNGQTGIPMVDAGMRELWQTGYMHNRVRMIVGSFLVKNLRLHWHYGERWFWDTLVDADLANNSASWQWIAGCGADAAPYFRIFNPVTQGQKFDPDGYYVRKWIPEISKLPNKYLFSPWEASESILDSAGVRLGKTYPRPIVDLRESRESALEAFQSLKKS